MKVEMRRILVIANETLEGAALRELLVERAGRGPVQVFVVCPALNTRLRHWLSDEDGARTRAEERLRASLAALAREGIDADGVVGDADPVVALGDGLRMFRAGEAIVSTHPPGRSNWLERNVVERARAISPVPVTHVVADGTRALAPALAAR
jgi:hypothetical protein